MRVRQGVRVDLVTGEVTGAAELVPDATVAERFAGLAGSLPDAGPGGVVVAWVRCDGCGVPAEVDAAAPVLPPGWAATPAGELCPACAAGWRRE